MGLISSLANLIKKVFKSVFGFIKKIFKKFWLIILIVVIIYFAPYLLSTLTSMGAPAFVTEGLAFVATNLTPSVVGAVEWLWSGVGSVGASAWSAFKASELSTKLALVAGAAALVAPEEFQQVITDAADLVGEVVGGVAGGIASGFFSSPIGMIAIGLGVWWLVSTSSKKKEDERLRREDLENRGILPVKEAT